MNPAVIEAIAHNIAAFGSLIAAVGSIIVSLKVKKDTQELRPNHGSSVKDTMNRVEAKVETLGARVDSNSETLNLVASDMTAIRSDLTEERKERRELSQRAEEAHKDLWKAVREANKGAQIPRKRQYRHQRR